MSLLWTLGTKLQSASSLGIHDLSAYTDGAYLPFNLSQRSWVRKVFTIKKNYFTCIGSYSRWTDFDYGGICCRRKEYYVKFK